MKRKEAYIEYEQDWEKTISNLKGKTDWYQEELKADCIGRHAARLDKILRKVESENKKLKKKLDECYVRYTKETSRLEQRNGNLEAKLDAIESNKVAEFSGEAVQRAYEPSYRFIDNGINEFIENTIMEAGKRYTVTISKDKQ